MHKTLTEAMQQKCLEQIRSMPPPKHADLRKIMEDCGMEFINFCYRHSLYDIYSREYIKSLAGYLDSNWKDSGILEVAAGDGRLTDYLRWAGVEMLQSTDSRDGKCCDFQEKFYGGNVIKMDALEAVAHFKPDLVIGAWFPYGSNLPEQILETETPLIFIGEGEGGCCGTEELWQWPYEKLDCSQYSICRTDYIFGQLFKIYPHSRAVLFQPREEICQQ